MKMWRQSLVGTWLAASAALFVVSGEALADSAPAPAPAPAPAQPVAPAPEPSAATLPPALAPAVTPNVTVVEPVDPVAKAAFEVLDKHCARCHQIGPKMTKRKVPPKGLGDILELDAIRSDSHLIVPGNPDGSLIFQQIAKQLMPYDVYQEADLDEASPNEADIAALRKWIESLSVSADAACAARKPVDETAMVGAMAADLQAEIPSRVKSMRFLTLTHLYNACVSDDELGIYRAGAVKLLNSLNHNSSLVKLETIDPAKTIIRFNLDDIGWSTADWDKLVAADPYAVKPDAPLFAFLAEQTATALPYLRADWFARVASRPPLYNALLGLPDTYGALQKQLGVDVTADIKALRVKRAAFQNSGVSKNNRLIERHDIQTGYFWTSYDFAGNRDKQSLFDFPLGPGGDFGFVHNGGETIWSLPDGMNGYYLNNAKGEKLDDGPVTIVLDRNHPEDPTVHNGISCMGCHDAGIKKARDEIRERDLEDKRFPRAQRDQIGAMFVPTEEMDGILAQDLQKFEAAVSHSGIDPQLREKKSGSEPINALSDWYDEPVDIKLAAAEFGMSKDKFIAAANTPEAIALVRRLDQGNIPRDQFETEYAKFVTVMTEDQPIAKAAAAAAAPAVAVAAPAPQNVDATHTFDLALFSDKSAYTTADHPVITVKSQVDCFLTLQDIDKSDHVEVLFPNKFQQDNRIAAGKEFVFPDPKAHFQFAITAPGVDTINAVCTQDKRVVDGIVHDFKKETFTSANNYSEKLGRSIVAAPKEAPKPGAAEARAAIKVTIN